MRLKESPKPWLVADYVPEDEQEFYASMLYILEREKKLPKGRRKETHANFVAVLFKKYPRLTKENQDRLVAIMSAGTPEERQRIAKYM